MSWHLQKHQKNKNKLAIYTQPDDKAEIKTFKNNL